MGFESLKNGRFLSFTEPSGKTNSNPKSNRKSDEILKSVGQPDFGFFNFRFSHKMYLDFWLIIMFDLSKYGIRKRKNFKQRGALKKYFEKKTWCKDYLH